MREVIRIVLVIIGAFIGAGFASGQEIYSFFFSYGTIGLLGLILTFSLTSFTIYKSLKIICEKQINNYDEFLSIFIPKRKITKVVNAILNILLLITFYIMIAGFGAYFEQELGIKKIIGSTILAIITAFVFFTNTRGIIKISEYIVPVLIGFLIIIGTINIITIKSSIEIPVIKDKWLLSSVIYCSYNIILLIPILISLRKQIKKISNIKYIAIISGILMIIISTLIFMLLTRNNNNISKLELPLVYVVGTYFPKLRFVYAFIILASIFTTAISIGMGLLQNISKNKKSYTQFVLFMCITSLLISNIGFSKLVNFIYPLFGYIGIIQIILINAYK